MPLKDYPNMYLIDWSFQSVWSVIKAKQNKKQKTPRKQKSNFSGYLTTSVHKQVSAILLSSAFFNIKCCQLVCSTFPFGRIDGWKGGGRERTEGGRNSFKLDT